MMKANWLKYSEIEEQPKWLNDVEKVWVWNENEESPVLCRFNSEAEEFTDDNFQKVCSALDLIEGEISEIFVHQAVIPAKPSGWELKHD